MTAAILIILFLMLSALFSGTEIAFISANKLKIELRKKKGIRRGSILAGFYEKPADFLGTMLVGNNIALVVFTTLMSAPLSKFLSDKFSLEEGGLQLFINTIIITIIILIFGEFLPKTIFRLFADRILYFLAYPLQFLKFLLIIPSWLMIQLSNSLLKLFFKTPIERDDVVFTRGDLENFIADTQTGPEEEIDIDTELFGKALKLKDVRARECMVPRPEIESIDVDASVEELKQKFIDSQLSRIIVVKDDINNILGYVHHQQLLKHPKHIRDLVFALPFIPEAMRVTDLMSKFIKERINIACVVDEFGGIAGLITLEDILEEIFGEIEDEYDLEEHFESQISDDEYIFSGRLEIDYLNDKYEHIQFPEGDYHTLSGYLVMTTETIPEQGAEIFLDGYRFILELVSDTKIETVRVFRLHKEPETVEE